MPSPRAARRPAPPPDPIDGDEGAANDPSARDLELLRRERRGADDLFTIRPLRGTRVLGAYEVASPSGPPWRVELRSLDSRENGCSCPDFATNLLGTCKHVEAVLHHLREDGPRRFQRALRAGSDASYLFLRFDPEPAVAIRAAERARPSVRRIVARHFDAAGRLRRPLEDCWTDLSRDAAEAGLGIPAEVVAHAERVLDATRLDRRRKAVEAEVRRAGRDQPGVRRELYPYQVDGVAFLASRGRALLADDMGLGKTAQAIAATVQLLRRGEVRRALVVCPASLKHQWVRELREFAGFGPEDVAVVSGPREVREALYADPPPVLVTSYELARADERALAAVEPDLLILDEAQRIKNWRTRTASVVKRIASRFAFVLTGTPLENRLDDLYSLMQVVDPHRFGPLWRFNERFARLDDAGRPIGYRNLDALRAAIAPVVLRRRKEEVLTDLPERIVSRVTVPMTPRQVDLHADAENTAARLLAVLRRRALTPPEEQRLMRAFQRMRMACDAAGLVDKKTPGAPKLDELARLLEEICLGEGHKVVVFSEWERMQALAAEVCKGLGIGYVRLHGGVPSDARGALIDRFREDPACQVFLSTDAGGVGLNLQAASHVVNLDLPWNPAVLAQRIARVHRLGQRKSVNVVLLVSEGGFEERMEATLETKRALFAAAVGDDTETTELERFTMAKRIASILTDVGVDAAARPRPASAAISPAPQVMQLDPVATVREAAGESLEQILRLSDGRVVGIVAGAVPAAAIDAATLIPSSAVAALAPLGAASPFVGAEVLYRSAPSTPEEARAAASRALASGAARKRSAGDALLAAGLASEALPLFRDAMALALRALDVRGDPGDEPAALQLAVHGHLLPSGAISAAEGAALARAGELARAFERLPDALPAQLAASIAGDARALVERARAAVGRSLVAPIA
ncbi:MAG TPA: DEAD/DEAH box helicase [Anaeromyxobacteraceae bacterium]|nr:DEAD/DEAH box helicase [Anaeromyxobacteraceae bacterium]